jgi:CheY-like chemotaxis protein
MRFARILVIDDNTADVNLLRVGLDRHGKEYELQVLSTGDEALRFVQEHKAGSHSTEPCVILLDLHLPKYDGLAILDALKQAPMLSHIHVIVLSGSASPSEQRKIHGMGAVYRQKPFSLDDYFELGSEILEICEGSRAIAA